MKTANPRLERLWLALCAVCGLLLLLMSQMELLAYEQRTAINGAAFLIGSLAMLRWAFLARPTKD